MLVLPNNKLQVLLDQDEDPELKDHWLTDSELESKRQRILDHLIHVKQNMDSKGVDYSR